MVFDPDEKLILVWNIFNSVKSASWYHFTSAKFLMKKVIPKNHKNFEFLRFLCDPVLYWNGIIMIDHSLMQL